MKFQADVGRDEICGKRTTKNWIFYRAITRWNLYTFRLEWKAKATISIFLLDDLSFVFPITNVSKLFRLSKHCYEINRTINQQVLCLLSKLHSFSRHFQLNAISWETRCIDVLRRQPRYSFLGDVYGEMKIRKTQTQR